MRRFQTLLFVLISLLGGASAKAQLATRAEDPKHEYALGDIKFMKLTDFGNLVVGHGNGLAGIDPNQAKPIFNFDDFGAVTEEELTFVPGTPYMLVGKGGGTSIGGTKVGGSITGRKAIVDCISGELLYDTKKDGDWGFVSSFRIFMPENLLVVSGSQTMKAGGQPGVSVYDLGKRQLVNFIKLKAKEVVTGEVFLNNGRLYVPTAKSLVCLDAKSGQEIFSTDIDDISWMEADETGKEIYGLEVKGEGKETKIFKFSPDGKLLWKEPQEVKGTVSRFLILPQGLAVVSDVVNTTGSRFGPANESKINFFDAKTGADLWDKAPKTKGYVQHFYNTDDGLIFGMYSGGINKISYDGQQLFRKPLKTGDNIHTMALTPKGMIYITDTDANIVDLSTGESIWGKAIKYKKAAAVASTYDAKGDRYLISIGDEVVAISGQSGDQSTLASYSFNEKEAPTSIQVRNNGILLASSQNVMLLDANGTQSYHSYYKSPGQSGVVKGLSLVMGVAAMAMSASAGYESGANGGQMTEYGRSMDRQSEMYGDIAEASFQMMNKRFKATSATQDAQFVLTKLDDGIGLVKVDKNNGAAVGQVVLKDRKPVYVVDEFGGKLFYQAKGNTIYVYDVASLRGA